MPGRPINLIEMETEKKAQRKTPSPKKEFPCHVHWEVKWYGSDVGLHFFVVSSSDDSIDGPWEIIQNAVATKSDEVLNRYNFIGVCNRRLSVRQNRKWTNIKDGKSRKVLIMHYPGGYWELLYEAASTIVGMLQVGKERPFHVHFNLHNPNHDYDGVRKVKLDEMMLNKDIVLLINTLFGTGGEWGEMHKIGIMGKCFHEENITDGICAQVNVDKSRFGLFREAPWKRRKV